MPPAPQPGSLFYPPGSGELFPHLCEKASFSGQKSAWVGLKLRMRAWHENVTQCRESKF